MAYRNGWETIDANGHSCWTTSTPRDFEQFYDAQGTSAPSRQRALAASEQERDRRRAIENENTRASSIAALRMHHIRNLHAQGRSVIINEPQVVAPIPTIHQYSDTPGQRSAQHEQQQYMHFSVPNQRPSGQWVESRVDTTAIQLAPPHLYFQREDLFPRQMVEHHTRHVHQYHGQPSAPHQSRRQPNMRREYRRSEWQYTYERQSRRHEHEHEPLMQNTEGQQVWPHAPVVVGPPMPVYYGPRVSQASPLAEVQHWEWINSIQAAPEVEVSQSHRQAQAGTQVVRAFVNVHPDIFNFYHPETSFSQSSNSGQPRRREHQGAANAGVQQRRRSASDAARQEERDFLEAQSLSMEDYARAQSQKPICAMVFPELCTREAPAGFTRSILDNVVCVSCNSSLKKTTWFLRQCGHVYCRRCVTKDGMVSKRQCSAAHCRIPSVALYREIFL